MRRTTRNEPDSGRCRLIFKPADNEELLQTIRASLHSRAAEGVTRQFSALTTQVSR
jgi:hypothetical protein